MIRLTTKVTKVFIQIFYLFVDKGFNSVQPGIDCINIRIVILSGVEGFLLTNKSSFVVQIL
ncbi:MAG: hypothetical protein DI529_06305 [Chryseobacterium sp.]|nr:MAG: hypothetical protein DI529_06305 [Chryseobacterium sp.]